MKKPSLTLLAAVSLALNASAITYQGTFTYTVFSVGTPIRGIDDTSDIIIGTYSYDSATLDGTFSPASGNLEVTFTFPDLSTLTETDGAGYPANPDLTVTGGNVTSFLFQYNEPGSSTTGTAYTFSATFGWSILGNIGGSSPSEFIFAIGDVGNASFSRPVTAPSTSVPDAGSTLALLGLSLAGLPFCRRKGTLGVAALA